MKVLLIYLPHACFYGCFATVLAVQGSFDKQLFRIHHKHSSFSIKWLILGFNPFSFWSPEVRSSLAKHSHLRI